MRDGLSRRRLLGGAVLTSAATAAFGMSRAVDGRGPAALTEQGARARDRAARSGPPLRPANFVETSFGVTVGGRPMLRWDARPSEHRVHVMVICGIHGYERVTLPLAASMLHARRPDDVWVTIVPSANPDGWAENTRRNANGVDLNRNFPWRWSPSTGGPRAASEPETQALMSLVVGERPDLCIWVHQPLAYVAPIGRTPIEYARVWAATVDDDVRLGVDQHGGSESWTARVAGLRSMLVEVESWNAGPDLIGPHTLAYERLLSIVQPDR